MKESVIENLLQQLADLEESKENILNTQRVQRQKNFSDLSEITKLKSIIKETLTKLGYKFQQPPKGVVDSGGGNILLRYSMEKHCCLPVEVSYKGEDYKLHYLVYAQSIGLSANGEYAHWPDVREHSLFGIRKTHTEPFDFDGGFFYMGGYYTK